MSGEKVLREGLWRVHGGTSVAVAGGGTSVAVSAGSADTCSRMGRRKVWRLDTA